MRGERLAERGGLVELLAVLLEEDDLQPVGPRDLAGVGLQLARRAAG